MAVVDRGGVEVIDRDECFDLLRSQVVGRVGIDAGGPLVLPVNYGLDGDAVVFRTGPGSKLDAARNRVACFEIDSFDPETRSGWSVIVRGRLNEVTHFDGEIFRRLEHLAEPWLGEEGRPHVLRLDPISMTGRRVRGGTGKDA